MSRHKLLKACERGDFLFPVLLLVVSKPLNLLRIRGWEEMGNHTVQMNTQMRASEIISVIPVILAVERDSTICVVDGGAGEREWIMTLLPGQDFCTQPGNFAVFCLEFHGAECGDFWELADLLSQAKHEVEWKEKVWQRRTRCRSPRGLGFWLGKCITTTKGETELWVWVVQRRQEAARCNGTRFDARESCV